VFPQPTDPSWIGAWRLTDGLIETINDGYLLRRHACRVLSFLAHPSTMSLYQIGRTEGAQAAEDLFSSLQNRRKCPMAKPPGTSSCLRRPAKALRVCAGAELPRTKEDIIVHTSFSPYGTH
jgi:hypothetical protein